MLLPNVSMQQGIPLGFCTETADVVFPLTKRFCLIGKFDGSEETVVANRLETAVINTKTIYNAERQIYAANKNFAFIDPSDLSVKDANELRAGIRSERQEKKGRRFRVDITN